MEWSTLLFESDAVEYLVKEKNTYPVAKELLSAITKIEINNSVNSFDESLAIKKTILRYPRFHIWLNTSTTEDAQICRALVGAPELCSSISTKVEMVSIARSLGEPLAKCEYLLTETIPQMDTLPMKIYLFEECTQSMAI